MMVMMINIATRTVTIRKVKFIRCDVALLLVLAATFDYHREDSAVSYTDTHLQWCIINIITKSENSHAWMPQTVYLAADSASHRLEAIATSHTLPHAGPEQTRSLPRSLKPPSVK